MNRILELFNDKSEDVLNIYFTAGFPKLESTLSIIHSLRDAGVDLIEVGIPYSDPLADGPTIQESGSLAIKNGITVDYLFKQLEEVRKTNDVPLILMGYLNQMMQYGVEEFLQKAQACTVDALIIPDLPMHEYENKYKGLFEKYGLGITFLVTPQTSEERIQKAVALSSDSFLYVISKASITGATADIEDEQMQYFQKINQLKGNCPSLIGFGIHDKKTFSTACQYANGAIIGSAFIRHIKEHGDSKESVLGFVNNIRE